VAPYVILLNQDVELDPGFLRHVVAVFSSHPSVGAVQGRIRRLDEGGTRSLVLDTTGLVMDRGRRVVARCQDEPDSGAHPIAGEVWGVDGPVAAYRTSALVDATLPRTGGGTEVLDEDFFMYKEDVDLAWRLRLLGWSTWYEPAALAWHARSVRSGRPVPRWIRAASWRNQHLMQLKNDSVRAFVRDMPWIVVREALTLGRLLFSDVGPEAVRDMLRALPNAMRKRRALWRRIRSRERASARVSLDPET
jgi:GT2 family glycosyltransferase